MKITLTILLFLLGLWSDVSAQKAVWSKPLTLPTAQHVRLVCQWRVVAIEREHAWTAIEWVFVNQSDSTVSFSYDLTTDQQERFTGRTSLLPRSRRVAGRYFHGNRISAIEVTDLQAGTHD